MTIGLGNLSELKAYLLPESMLQRTDFDTPLSVIGKGVASGFDHYCNRVFARLAGATETFTADRDHYFVRRFPIETVTTLELLYSDNDGWEAQDSEFVTNTDNESGRLWFGFFVGDCETLVRVTYTGGYWVDPGDGTSQPANSTAVPDDLKFAWMTQCQHVWNSRDKLGKSLAKAEEPSSALSSLDLVPSVEACLRRHIRYEMT